MNRSECFSCLIVEDDAAFAATAARVVEQEGGKPIHAPTLAAAREITASKSFDLVLLDNHLPDGRGYDFFDQISRRNPGAPVMMITGMPDLSDAVSLTRNGLFEYITKPVSVESLTASLARAKLRMKADEPPADSSEWFGESAAMRDVMQQLRQAAKHPTSTVLLTGETGCGKDLAARVLHRLSFPDDNGPFIAVNCAALPAEMFESELFGAERGAYTGAERKRGGLVAAAGNGTLFLDEIAEVPLALQAKLLRLLEGREYRALGSTETLTFTGRFVAATNKNLAEEVKAGRFREDLLYRLDVFSVELPPLRSRRADIPGLAERLLTQLVNRYGRTKPLLKPEEVTKLSAHSFPGNVRELRNVLERSLLKTDDAAKWLALDLNWLQRSSPTATPSSAAPAAKPTGELPPGRELSLVELQEYRLIRDTLRETNGGIRRAATKIGISPQALLRRLEKWPELRCDKS
ncbi:MAG TPA: sigma-54 dependent transcriptional regulator [Candidatus Paceibacterota bacterium]|nr:sigma-54 dependent transcriptional regulator [Candidatus Paceibacterota bacterium]